MLTAITSSKTNTKAEEEEIEVLATPVQESIGHRTNKKAVDVSDVALSATQPPWGLPSLKGYLWLLPERWPL